MLSGLMRWVIVSACSVGFVAVPVTSADACWFGWCGWAAPWQPRTYASYYPPAPVYGPAAYDPCGCSPCGSPCGGSPCGPGGCATGNCGINYVPSDAPRTAPSEDPLPEQDIPRTYRDDDPMPPLDDLPPRDDFLPRGSDTPNPLDTDAFRPESTIPKRDAAPADGLFDLPNVPNDTKEAVPEEVKDNTSAADERVLPILRVDDKVTSRTPLHLTRLRSRDDSSITTRRTARPVWADLPATIGAMRR